MFGVIKTEVGRPKSEELNHLKPISYFSTILILISVSPSAVMMQSAS